jgi:membrane associated rhomboid family serine protease
VLIIPLHRALSRSNFPIVTAALIVLNCFIYVFAQGGDARVEQQAIAYYDESGLGSIEFPAFVGWLRERGDMRWQLAADDEAPPEFKLQLLQSDAAFLRELHADRIITPARADYADWHAGRAEFERMLGNTFTERYDLHYSEFSPKRLVGSMFLHGSAGHLVGNMIFLALLGLLVEGALGPWLFLGIYLAGGLGAGLASLAWRWGDVGSGLGASGAIAGLMGAYCVLWGVRKVRVFYWFFIVFDYVRVPALTLLPFWLGWEVWQLLADRTAHVAFDEHAGGIVCGAALAWGVRRLGWERREFLAEDERAEQRDANVGALARALEHLGRLEIAPARRLLEKIDADEPGRLPVLVALYRCARYAGNAGEIDRAARRVFAFDARSEPDITELKAVWDDYSNCPGAAPLAPEPALRLMRLWLRIRADADAEKLLREMAARSPMPAGIDAAWFAFAQRAPENSAARRDRLGFILRQFPQSTFAKKAQFLLEQVPGTV